MAKLEEIEKRLERLEDLESIARTLFQWIVRIDNADLEAVMAPITDDCVLEWLGNRHVGKEAVRKYWTHYFKECYGNDRASGAKKPGYGYLIGAGPGKCYVKTLKDGKATVLLGYNVLFSWPDAKTIKKFGHDEYEMRKEGGVWKISHIKWVLDQDMGITDKDRAIW